MNLKNLANEAVSEIDRSMPNELTEAESAAIAKIVENTLVEAVSQTSRSCRDAAVVCCGPEADMAHKIAEEVKLARKALIANLMGPR